MGRVDIISEEHSTVHGVTKQENVKDLKVINVEFIEENKPLTNRNVFISNNSIVASDIQFRIVRQSKSTQHYFPILLVKERGGFCDTVPLAML